MELVKQIAEKFKVLNALFDERHRRLWAATEAKAIGFGGLKIVHEATGLAKNTIRAGLEEIKPKRGRPSKKSPLASPEKVRKEGGGRKTLEEKQPGLEAALDALIAPETRGDPESPLRWTTKSTRNLVEALQEKGFKISAWSVGNLLKTMGYSLQGSVKTKEGNQHADRDLQFQYLNKKTIEFQEQNLPVISVDTKKKELIGNFKNKGVEWSPKGEPDKVNAHDFPDPELGKVVPYGVYDVTDNSAFVNVGINHDTAEFAVQSIRNWWLTMGAERYPEARKLFVTADSGGSNSARSRLWKSELQKLSDDLNIEIHVSHYPPGTSKWNKIEHRLFSYISMNWRNRALLSYEIVINLIANTTNSAGLKIRAKLDKNVYETGKKITNKQMNSLNIVKDDLLPDWNYILTPNNEIEKRE